MFASRLRRAAPPPTRLPLPTARRPHRGRGISFPKGGIASVRSTRCVIVCGASKTIQAEGGIWPLAPNDHRGRGRFLSARTDDDDDDFELPPLDLTSLSSLSIPLPPNMLKESGGDATEGGDVAAGGKTSRKIDSIGIEPNADGQRRGGGSFLSRGIAMMKKRPTNGRHKTRDAPERGKTSVLDKVNLVNPNRVSGANRKQHAQSIEGKRDAPKREKMSVLDKVNPSRVSGADWKQQAQSIKRKQPHVVRTASPSKMAGGAREALLEKLKNEIKEAEEAILDNNTSKDEEDGWAQRLSLKRRDLSVLREETMQEQRREAIKPKPRKFDDKSLLSGSSLPYSAARSNAPKHFADGNHPKEALLACKKDIQSWLEDEFPRPSTGSPPKITGGKRFGHLTKLNDRIKESEEGILDKKISSTKRERLAMRLFDKMQDLHVLKEYGLSPSQFKKIKSGIGRSINISWCERRWGVLRRRQQEFYAESPLSSDPRHEQESVGSNADDRGKHASGVGDEVNADEIGPERSKMLAGIESNHRLRMKSGACTVSATEETAVADDLASVSCDIQANGGEDVREMEKMMMDDNTMGDHGELEGMGQRIGISLDESDEEGSDDHAEDHGRFAKDEFDDEESIYVLSPESSNTAGGVYQARWMERYTQLKLYKSLNGHTNVPRRSSDYPKLGPWVDRQRIRCKKGSLADDRVQLLNDIGFVWSPDDRIWEQRFNDLKQYKSLNGHTNVPSGSSEHPVLANWVAKQRRLYKKGSLAEDRVQFLNDIGFVWSPGDHLWEQRLNELQQYKNLNGHANVPWGSSEHGVLGTWVAKQRNLYKKGSLADGRVQRLNDVGFAWSLA